MQKVLVNILRNLVSVIKLKFMSIFNSIPIKRVKHTPFNLSHPYRMSGRFGRLYPFNCRKVVPSDRFIFQNQSFTQFATMATKVYQEFTVKMERFFVPSRLLWDDFKKFYSQDDSSADELIHPYFNYADIVGQGLAYHGSLFDYFNLPTFFYPDGFINSQYPWSDLDWSNHLDDLERLRSIYEQRADPIYHLDALKFLAFVMVYSQYYADENLQPDIADWDRVNDGFQGEIIQHNSDLTTLVVFIAQQWSDNVLNRNYPKDYFTGALPFAQKGPQVNIPFTGTGYAEFYADADKVEKATDPEYVQRTMGYTSDGFSPFPGKTRVQPTLRYGQNGVSPTTLGQGETAAVNNLVKFENGLTSIENLRTAMVLQQFYENDARGGNRFKETLLHHFNSYNKDARLQRAEFLQGVTTQMTIGNVYSTSANTENSGITGEPVSVVNGAGLSRKRKFRATEPGYLINLVSVYPKAAYYKGVPREWMELDRFDYLWPEFQHLGEQEVKVIEVSMGNHLDGYPTQKDSDTFGYNPRYAQYRYAFSEVHGDFRDRRKSMTASRDFASGVALNEDFIKIDIAKNNLNRVFNYTEDDFDTFDMDINEILFASRPLDYYGVPRFII